MGLGTEASELGTKAWNLDNKEHRPGCSQEGLCAYGLEKVSHKNLQFPRRPRKSQKQKPGISQKGLGLGTQAYEIEKRPKNWAQKPEINFHVGLGIVRNKGQELVIKAQEQAHRPMNQKKGLRIGAQKPVISMQAQKQLETNARNQLQRSRNRHMGL